MKMEVKQFTPQPTAVVLASTVEDGRTVHTLRAPGEEHATGPLKLAYVVAEGEGGSLEVIREVFYREDPYGPVSVEGADVDDDQAVFYTHSQWPTLEQVRGRSLRSLRRTESVYHQDSLSVDDAKAQLTGVAAPLLSRYLTYEPHPARRGWALLVLSTDPSSVSVLAVEAGTRGALEARIDEHFGFEIVGGAEDLTYYYRTPWGNRSVTELTRYETTAPDVTHQELASVLSLLLSVERAEDELREALQREEERAGRGYEEEDDIDLEDAEDEDAVMTQILDDLEEELVREAAIRESNGLPPIPTPEDELEEACDVTSDTASLIRILASDNRVARMAAVKNPALDRSDLEAYARGGSYTDTRLQTLEELARRTR